MRRVIQISSNHLENTSTTQASFVLYALCDDGTIWESWGGRPWIQIPPVPGTTDAP